MELKVLPQSQMMRQRRASYDRSAARLSPETLSRILDAIPVIATQTDVDKHWNVVMKHCQRHLNWYFAKKKRVQRQIYFSARTWQILNGRKDTQKEINALERRESLLFKDARKKDLYQHRLNFDIGFVEAVSSSQARRIFQALRPKRPVARCKGIKAKSPLPELQLHGVEGLTCSCSSRLGDPLFCNRDGHSS